MVDSTFSGCRTWPDQGKRCGWRECAQGGRTWRGVPAWRRSRLGRVDTRRTKKDETTDEGTREASARDSHVLRTVSDLHPELLPVTVKTILLSRSRIFLLSNPPFVWLWAFRLSGRKISSTKIHFILSCTFHNIRDIQKRDHHQN